MSQDVTTIDDVDAPMTFSNLMATAKEAVPERAPIREKFVVSPELRQRVAMAVKEVDFDKPDTLISWGGKAQENLGRLSMDLIEKTKSKDAGPAGALLSRLVLNIKGFKVDDIEQAEHKASGISRLWTKATLPVQVAVQRYSAVQSQVNTVVNELDSHIGKLMHDVVMMERMYDENAKAYETMQVYVAAGKVLMQEVEENRLPALQAAINEEDPLTSENYAKMVKFKNRLERRLADMTLTRTVLLQGLPAIALIEDNDVNMIERIQSTINHAVPLWHRQIAMLLATRRGADAAQAQHDAADLTNALLVQTSKQINRATVSMRTEIERGLFDSAKVAEANDNLIASMESAITIYEEASARRKNDVKVADKCERELQVAIQGVKRIGVNVAA